MNAFQFVSQISNDDSKDREPFHVNFWVQPDDSNRGNFRMHPKAEIVTKVAMSERNDGRHGFSVRSDERPDT
jgi:hypothetical protein